MRTDRMFWWIERWRESRAFQTMNLEQQGLHRELVGQYFLRGSLPFDFLKLMRATGTTLNEWARCWDVVRNFWRVQGEWLIPGDEVRLYTSRFHRLPPLVRLSHRDHIPIKTQRFVLERDNGHCVKCGTDRSLEYDHIIRRRDGGEDSTDNLRLLCRVCNRRRG